MAGGSKRVLDRAEGTCADSAGAGIAVKAGNTDRLRLSLVDLSVYKAFEMRIIEKSAVKLYELSC